MLLYRRLYDDLYYAIFFPQIVTRYEESEKHQTAELFENGPQYRSTHSSNRDRHSCSLEQSVQSLWVSWQ